jgi:adenosine deaminase
MMTPLDPLGDVAIPSWLAALPKADLHVHQEVRPRYERVRARRDGRAPYDWRAWSRHLLNDIPPGMPRLEAMVEPDLGLPTDVLDSDDRSIVAYIADVLDDAAADGALLVEVRFGASGRAFFRPDFMALFREAERQIQARYPRLCAEAIGFLAVGAEQSDVWEQQFAACLQHAQHGLVGVDFVVTPYATDADPTTWATAHHWAAQAAAAGLGITVHAGEFSTANLDAALRTPGLRRLGHAVYATQPHHMEQIGRQQLTIECCLSCNVVLGAVASYIEHPIEQFRAYGIPVTLNTDDPVRIATTIGREYAIAAALGWSADDLLQCTRTAIRASFTSIERRDELLAEIEQFRNTHL